MSVLAEKLGKVQWKDQMTVGQLVEAVKAAWVEDGIRLTHPPTYTDDEGNGPPDKCVVQMGNSSIVYTMRVQNNDGKPLEIEIDTKEGKSIPVVDAQTPVTVSVEWGKYRELASAYVVTARGNEDFYVGPMGKSAGSNLGTVSFRVLPPENSGGVLDVLDIHAVVAASKPYFLPNGKVFPQPEQLGFGEGVDVHPSTIMPLRMRIKASAATGNPGLLPAAA